MRLVFAALLLPSAALAVPGPPGWQPLRQPDGTPVELRYEGGCGSPIHLRDRAGHLVVGRTDARGTRWEYGRWDGDQLVSTGVLVGEGDPRTVGVVPWEPVPVEPLDLDPVVARLGAGAGHLGAPLWAAGRHTRSLVILVRFPGGVPNSRNHTYTREQFVDLLFADGLDPTRTGLPATWSTSMRDHYDAMSNGTWLSQSGDADVVGWVEVPDTYETYIGNAGGFGIFYPHNAAGLFHDAVAAVDPLVDFSDYDGDGDGEVDHVILVVEGRADGSLDFFWPHMAVTAENAVHDGVSLRRYMLVNEQLGVATPGADLRDIHPIGTFAHELGHILGLPDLYDGDYTSHGVGMWSLMGAGSYFRGDQPAYMDAWSRMQLGWEVPLVPGPGRQLVELGPVGSGYPSILYLPLDPYGRSEALVVEARSRSQEPGLAGEGLLVWQLDQDHIDEHLRDNSVQLDEAHPGLKLLQADNRRDLQNLRNEGDAGDPYPGSSGSRHLTPDTRPNSLGYGGFDNGVRITDIGPPGTPTQLTVETRQQLGVTLAHDTFAVEGQRSVRDRYTRVRFELTEEAAPHALRVFVIDANKPIGVSLSLYEDGSDPLLTTTLAPQGRGWNEVSLDAEALAAGSAVYAFVDRNNSTIGYDAVGPVSGNTATGPAWDALVPGPDANVRLVLTSCDDDDGDGVAVCEGDCDDTDPDVHPGAVERCNLRDDDCDGELGPTEIDQDEDGAAVCDGDCDDADPFLHTLDEDGDGVTSCDGDCDDRDAARAPGLPEVCDGRDNDCDGVIPADERDEDGDGYAVCDGDCDDGDRLRYPADDDEDGFTRCDGDCADDDPERYPGQVEACNGLDDDCDGVTPPDEVDADRDGIAICGGDCDDADINVSPHDYDHDGWSSCDGDCRDFDEAVHPGATEICNGLDDDCDGVLGEGEGDADGDRIVDCLDPDDDGDTVDDEVDPDPNDPLICGDVDGDGCDDCAERGVPTPGDDGFDRDGDGLCDLGDPDRDGDTIPNAEDPDPDDRNVCGDVDGDGCDDCARTGEPDPANDGLDSDGDGLCDAAGAPTGDPMPVGEGCGGGCATGDVPGGLGALAGLALLAIRRRRR